MPCLVLSYYLSQHDKVMPPASGPYFGGRATGELRIARIFGVTVRHTIQVALRSHCVAGPPLQDHVQYYS